MDPATAFARYRPLVDEWRAFLAALERPLPTCAWTNTLRTTLGRVRDGLARAGAGPVELGWLPGAFRLDPRAAAGTTLEFLVGLCHLQEEASLLPPLLLDPRPGERVLDLCAAPGGKTAQIAAAMEDRGTLVANDRDTVRMIPLRRTIQRLGLTSVVTTACDGANYPPAAGLFDRVLVDAPCSCEGTSRKSPEVLAKSGRASALAISGVQRALLRKAVLLARPGGRIVYSTCTYAPEENERVVASILAEGSVRVVPVGGVPGFATVPGVSEWEGEPLDPSLAGCLRVWPHHNDTGGFFVAVLEKTGGEGGAKALGVPGRARETEGSTSPSSEIPPLGDEVDPAPWLGPLEERYGIPRETFAGHRLVPAGGDRLSLLAASALPPAEPPAVTRGLPFLHAGMRHPKPTTAAVLAFGPAATRQRVALDPVETDAYLRRAPIDLPEDRLAGCRRGHVLVEHEGVFLGGGQLVTSPGGAGRIESQFPKGWALPAGRSAFG